MLKLYRNVLAAGVVALGLAACGDKVTVTNPPTPTPVVHSVVVVPASVTLTAGQTATFVASVVADSGLSSAVTWTSTAAATIVTITTNSAGQAVVTAVGAGQATIIATSTADPTKSGAGSVSVQALPPNILAFSVNPTNANIAVGGSLQVNPSVTTSAGAPAATITYATSSAATATVSASGQITGVSNGTAVITATATSGTQTATATVGVTVGSGPQGVVSFSVTPSAMTLFATQTQQATATVVSPGFTYPVTWTSLAPSVATVNSTGLVTAVAQGTAVVTATIGTAPNTLTQSVVVTVAQGASISIAAVNAGATAGTVAGCAGVTGAPVILTNVNCQIDVVLNLNAGVQPLDSLNVYMQHGIVASGAPTFDGKATPVCAAASAPCPFYKRAGNQSYGNTIPSSGPVNISINTAGFTKNIAAGTAVVDWYNGPAGVISQVFPHGLTGGQVTDCQIGAADQRCASINSIVFNNTDGWAADVAKCTGSVPVSGVAPVCPAAHVSVAAGVNTSTGGFAVDVNGSSANVGKTYWGGPGTTGEIAAELYAVVYDDNPGFPSGSALNRCNNALGNGTGCITTVSWTIGSTSVGFGHCNYVSQSATTAPGTPIFQQTFGTSGTGLTNNCGGHENLLARRDNILIAAGALDAQNNSYAAGILIPNAVAPFATPDSFRIDWAAPGTNGGSPGVTSPTVLGAENQNWVNKNWVFNPGGTLVQDGGVGPAASSWAAFCSNVSGAVCTQGGTTNFVLPVATGGDAVLSETNTKTVDGYTLIALGTDLLGNGTTSSTAGTFGVDRTSPLIRISTVGAPSSEGAGVYAGGGAASVLDSTVYNAVGGVYGTLVATAGARIQFLSAAYGTGDSLRIEAQDSRSGLRRALGTTLRFIQNGATGSNGTSGITANTYNTTAFLPATVDGWLPVPALHVLAGAPGTGVQIVSGYYTTTEYVVDNAGNVSGCPFTGPVSGSVCTASIANATANTNPAMGTVALQNANLFARRTLALDSLQPQVTGVSPNNNYTGNSAQTWTLGAQDNLEVIDTRFRIQYPNLTTGLNTEVATATNGLVWSYALSNTFMPSGNSAGPASAAFAPATAASGTNFGFFTPLGIRFDGAVNALPGNGLGIVNPLLKAVSLDLFTLNIQETCTNPTALFGGSPGTGFSSAMAVSTQCNAGMAVGDPIPTSGAGSTALQKPTNLGVQVRDVYGSWVFNDNPGLTAPQQATGVSAEFISPVLSSTVAAPGGYSVSYTTALTGLTSSCPEGGAVQPAGSASCVNSGINFRADLFYTTAGTKVYRSTEKLSNTLPVFTRVELYGLNTLGQWVFISRITVPSTIATGAGCPATVAGLTAGTVLGCDNGNERYWFFTFTAAGSFTAYRAIGVNSSGFGLASTIN